MAKKGLTGNSNVEPVMASYDTSQEAESAAFAEGHEEIAQLAYFYWEARGCPVGSPEEDWYRAENELRKPLTASAAA